MVLAVNHSDLDVEGFLTQISFSSHANQAEMMSDSLYFLIVRIISWIYWRGRLLGAENLPEKGPAVLVANHLGPKGPIGTVCSVPQRLYPWIIADMLDKKLAADYLRVDFVERTLKLKPPLSLAVARGIALISVPLLTELGCVPVNRGDYHDVQNSLHGSITILKEGKILLVFPEDPEGEVDLQTSMQPFFKGFTRLGELFYTETGKILSFYPVAVHESRNVKVGKPVPFEAENSNGLERQRLKHWLENEIREMYLEMARNGEV